MANVNVRIDGNIKADAEAVFSDLGLTPSTAINLFYKQVIRTHSIPFPLKAETPNRKTKKALREAEKIEKHPNKYKKYDSVEDLMEDLNNWPMVLGRLVSSKKIINYALNEDLE